MQSCVEVPFLPSDVDRLILGYLSDSKYTDTYKCLLRESPFLHEYTYLLNLGVVCPTTTCDGHSLLDILSDFFGQKRRQKQQPAKRLAQGRLSQAREQLLHTSSQQSQLATSSPAPSSTPMLNSTASVMLQISAAQLRQLQQQQQQQILQVQPEQQQQEYNQNHPKSVQQQQQQEQLRNQQDHSILVQQHQQEQQAQLRNQQDHSMLVQQHQQEQQAQLRNQQDQSMLVQQNQLHTQQDTLQLQHTYSQQSPQVPPAHLLEDIEEVPEEADVCVAVSASSSASTEPPGPGCSSSSPHGNKKKRRPRKELLSASVVAVPLFTKPLVERKKLIDRVLSSPDKFANSWEQAVSSRKLDTDTEKLKALLDNEQQADQRDELADAFLAAIFDDSLPPEAQEQPPPQAAEQPQPLSRSTLVEASGLPSCQFIQAAFPGAQIVLAEQLVEARLLHIREEDELLEEEGVEDEDEVANIVCDSMHIESIMTELNSPFRKADTPGKAASLLPLLAPTSTARRQIVFVSSAAEAPAVPLPLPVDAAPAMEKAASLTPAGRGGLQQANKLSGCISNSAYWAGVSCDLDESLSSPGLRLPPDPVGQQQLGQRQADVNSLNPSPEPIPTAEAAPATAPLTPPAVESAPPSSELPTPMRKRLRSGSLLTTQHQQLQPSPAASPAHSPTPTPWNSGRKRSTVTTTFKVGFTCALCNHTYSSRGRLDRHLQVHQEITRASADAAAAAKKQQHSSTQGGVGSALSKRVRTDLKAMDINSFINSIAARK